MNFLKLTMVLGFLIGPSAFAVQTLHCEGRLRGANSVVVGVLVIDFDLIKGKLGPEARVSAFGHDYGSMPVHETSL